MEHLQRFLDLVRHELSCDDARFEFGGRSPEQADSVFAEIPGGWRVVALFAAPLDDPAQPEAKLAALVESFAGVSGLLQVRSPRLATPAANREIDDALAVLAAKADALRAVVIDEDSPVLWGTSEDTPGPEDVEIAMWIGELADSAAAAGVDIVELVGLDEPTLAKRLAKLTPRKLRERLQRKLPVIRELGSHRGPDDWPAHFATCRAIAAVRRAPENHEAIEDDLGWLARDFAGIYHVILVYGGPFSEIGAAGVMLRAVPAIEKLVLSLPPIDPAPKGARVLPFKRV
ncbi:hypothetical protein ENSA5_43480 [Enhygromyxa salina]|uniref:Uncharacterized protein n=1 Tax=Enhygromyxa salina TaxID=215803 RepID=A0A2S9XK72_9BACT|nr:hypothetical protein [Enhygromyxa salina]PRP93253.1 hypothetical protein ENSA5_43480 [Enhygromyxa salina]